MKTINILIVEDDPIEALTLKQMLNDVGYFNITMVSSGEKAVSFVKNESIDLALMDINLSGTIDGIQTAINLNKIRSIHIIYITSLRDKKTFTRAKQTFPELFLSKPYNTYQLLDCIESIIAQNISKHIFKGYFFAKKTHDNTFYKISKKDIVYLEADNSYTVLYTTTLQNLVITKNLKHSLRILDENYFIRVSRSMAVNIHHIDSLKESQSLTLKHTTKTITITSSYKTEFLNLINQIKL